MFESHQCSRIIDKKKKKIVETKLQGTGEKKTHK